jgi:hypothetical protein
MERTARVTALALLLFTALVGLGCSSGFSTRVTGNLTTGVEFSFFETDSDKAITVEVLRFGVEEFQGGDRWRLSWYLEGSRSLHSIQYDRVPQGLTQQSQAHAMTPNGNYRVRISGTRGRSQGYSLVHFAVNSAGEVKMSGPPKN